MKKILLIEPKPSADNIFSAFYLPRLGLPILGAILKRRGYDVDIYLQNKNSIPLRKIKEADLVGVTTTTSTCYKAYKIARLARSFDKPVILGGSHVTFMPEEGLRHSDVVVRNEGEESTPKVVEALLSGGPLDDIAGISFIKDGRIISTNDAPFIADLDSIPYPDLSLIRGKGKVKVSVQTSRGCPHKCTFCSVTPMFGHQYRFRSPENVVDELKSYKTRRIFFCDDNFTAIPSHTKELLELMIRNNVGQKGWTAQTRVDIARDDELLSMMRRAGCGYVYIGFESVNPKTLEKFHKKQAVEEIMRSIERHHHHHIGVHGMFVLGADDDNLKTVRDTLVFANKMRIDSVQLLSLIPLPGTTIHAEYESANRITNRDWRLYDGHHVVYAPKLMTSRQLHQSAMKAMLDFYSFPKALEQLKNRSIRNFAIRLLGFYLVRKSFFFNRDFIKGLIDNESLSVNSDAGRRFEFKDKARLYGLLWNIVNFRGKLKFPKLKILHSEELKTRASFFRLLGSMDGFIDSNRVALSVYRAVLKGKTNIVINFNHVRSVKPRAIKYLTKCLVSLESVNRSLFIVALDPKNQSLMLATAGAVPCFEFFDTEDDLLKYLSP